MILVDALMLVLNICYLAIIVRDKGIEYSSNIRGYVITSLILTILSIILAVKWWAWPLKMSKHEDYTRVFERAKVSASKEVAELEAYNLEMRNFNLICGIKI